MKRYQLVTIIVMLVLAFALLFLPDTTTIDNEKIYQEKHLKEQMKEFDETYHIGAYDGNFED